MRAGRLYLDPLIAIAFAASCARSPAALGACAPPGLDTSRWRVFYTLDSTASFRITLMYRRIQFDSAAAITDWFSRPGPSGAFSLTEAWRSDSLGHPTRELPLSGWLPKGDTATRGYDLAGRC